MHVIKENSRQTPIANVIVIDHKVEGHEEPAPVTTRMRRPRRYPRRCYKDQDWKNGTSNLLRDVVLSFEENCDFQYVSCNHNYC